jgi:exosortase
LISKQIRLRVFYFAGFVLASVLVFWRSLSMLVQYSLEHEFCSHILLIAPLSLFLLYRDRTKIFLRLSSSFIAGSTLLLVGIVGYEVSGRWLPVLGQNDALTVSVVSIVMVWFGGFFLFFGATAFRKALFPMLFLILMAPLPSALLGRAIYGLQVGSTAISYWLFQLVGVPVLQEGFVLHMPTLSIEVAKECSSIRSSLALFITALLAAHLFLRSIGEKVALVAVAIPLALVKNGIRIVTLSLLSIYVDRGFLTGRLHHEGGVVFFLLDCIILFGLLRLFQWWEDRRDRMSLEVVEQ